MTPLKGLTAIFILMMLLAALTTAACGSQDQPTDTSPAATPTRAAALPATTTAPAEPTRQPAASTAVPTRIQETPSSPATVEPQHPTPAQTPADARTQPPAGPSPSGQETPAARAEPTATPQTGGICDRTPAVQDAILAALDQSACSAVTDVDLATIKSLSLKTVSVSATDVAGLTAITDIDLELTEGLDAHLASLTTLRNAHITFHLEQTYGEPVPEEVSERYNIPEDFLPHRTPNDQSQSEIAFDTLYFTISQGLYPGYLHSKGPAPADSTGLASHLLASRYAATNVHIIDRSFQSRETLTSYPLPNLDAGAISHLTIEIEVNTPQGTQPPSSLRVEPGRDWARVNQAVIGNRVSSLKLVLLNPDIRFQIPEDFLHRNQIAGPLTLEIRGSRLSVDERAFYNAYNLEELHLDFRGPADEHQLYFTTRGQVVSPSGTGFVNRSQ